MNVLADVTLAWMQHAYSDLQLGRAALRARADRSVVVEVQSMLSGGRRPFTNLRFGHWL
jgi:hypothetical protein